jgi:hypothetical protein
MTTQNNWEEKVAINESSGWPLFSEKCLNSVPIFFCNDGGP